jgi:hypothetical protein
LLDEKNRLDFLMALGQEFCTVLAPLIEHEGDLCPQMGYEVFSSVLGEDFTDDSLRGLPGAQVEELSARARSLLECSTVRSIHLREVIRRTLARW